MKTNLSALAARRRQLQHSADDEYPHTDPANAGMRRKFDLPLDRPANAGMRRKFDLPLDRPLNP